MSQDTSSTGVFNMLFGWIAGLIIKAFLIGGVVAGAIALVGFYIFR